MQGTKPVSDDIVNSKFSQFILEGRSRSAEQGTAANVCSNFPHYTPPPERRRLPLAQAALFFGTFAPFLRASESPIAIACFRLFTLPPFPPRPERSVPFFSRRMALSTAFPAALPYLRPLDFLRELEPFFAAI
jgi:hypothetical protein